MSERLGLSCAGYLLNRVWTDDYCVWIQQIPQAWLLKLAEKLERVNVRKDLIRWPLSQYEHLAMEEDSSEDVESSRSEQGDVPAGNEAAAAGSSSPFKSCCTDDASMSAEGAIV